jgi:methionine-rich copper-binding protein CopC
MQALRFPIRAALVIVAVVASSAALAHPKLVSSTPADKAEVSAPQKIELKFCYHATHTPRHAVSA